MANSAHPIARIHAIGANRTLSGVERNPADANSEEIEGDRDFTDPPGLESDFIISARPRLLYIWRGLPDTHHCRIRTVNIGASKQRPNVGISNGSRRLAKKRRMSRLLACRSPRHRTARAAAAYFNLSICGTNFK